MQKADCTLVLTMARGYQPKAGAKGCEHQPCLGLCAAAHAMKRWGQKQDGHNQGTLGPGSPSLAL